MPAKKDDKVPSGDEYKKVTEELYKQNLELVKLYKKVGSLNQELGDANKKLQNLITQKESLVHLVTHKVKTSFTHSKYIFAGMLDGSFGEISPSIKEFAQRGLESDNVGIKTVDLVLNADNLQKGSVKYSMKTLDLYEIVQSIIKEKEGTAKNKGIKIENITPGGEYNVLGDSFWLKEAIENLIGNSLLYTIEGSITIELKNLGDKILFKITDTGVGILPEDMKILFTEGGRGTDSTKYNVDSTGYGLFSVKLIVDAHKGRVWGESEGLGKGSTFYIELPSA
jgi:signal transduction histidine kinase